VGLAQEEYRDEPGDEARAIEAPKDDDDRGPMVVPSSLGEGGGNEWRSEGHDH